jgi:hypothetical protein
MAASGRKACRCYSQTRTPKGDRGGCRTASKATQAMTTEDGASENKSMNNHRRLFRWTSRRCATADFGVSVIGKNKIATEASMPFGDSYCRSVPIAVRRRSIPVGELPFNCWIPCRVKADFDVTTNAKMVVERAAVLENHHRGKFECCLLGW